MWQDASNGLVRLWGCGRGHGDAVAAAGSDEARAHTGQGLLGGQGGHGVLAGRGARRALTRPRMRARPTHRFPGLFAWLKKGRARCQWPDIMSSDFQSLALFGVLILYLNAVL